MEISVENNKQVELTKLNMTFWNMVRFLVKWFFASILAGIVVGIIIFFVIVAISFATIGSFSLTQYLAPFF